MQFRYLIHSPVTWTLSLAFVFWLWLALGRSGAQASRLQTVLIWSGFGAWLCLYALSTPLVAGWFQRLLAVDDHSPQGDFQPAYILVASAGYVQASHPDADVLTETTALRTARAVSWFKEVSGAVLVMQGISCPSGGNPERASELMHDMAVAMGVPKEKIVLEPRSRNTAEHLHEFLQFPGIDRSTPIGIVSSSYHLRRLRMLFAPEFDYLALRGVAASSCQSAWLTAILPHENALGDNATHIRELLALVYYRIFVVRR